MHEAIYKMQSAEKFKTPLTLILSPRRGEANRARYRDVCVQRHGRSSPLLLEKRRGKGEELIVI
jgi:hypothetical protein